MTTLLLLSNNLMFLPRIQQAAGSKVTVIRASDLDRLHQLIEEGGIDIVVADLEYDQDFWSEALKIFHESEIKVYTFQIISFPFFKKLNYYFKYFILCVNYTDWFDSTSVWKTIS